MRRSDRMQDHTLDKEDFKLGVREVYVALSY
jgi:hypothetical protein